MAYGRCFDLPVLAFRFFNVFGPLQSPDHEYAAVVPTFVDSALRETPLPVHGDGGQSRDFTFVDSVTDVLTDSVRRTVTDTEPINLAFGSRVTLLDLIALLEKVLGRALDRNHLDQRPGDVRDSQADQTKLKELFPRHTSGGARRRASVYRGMVPGRIAEILIRLSTPGSVK